MRIVIQRSKKASVRVEGKLKGTMDKGLVLLVGIAPEDSNRDIVWAAKKIVNMRIFNDAQGKMNLSLLDVGGGLLVVSQFTLFASYKKGNRPSFAGSAEPDKARQFYEEFVAECKKFLPSEKVQTGEFGAMMEVELINDGPVTIVLDTLNKE